MTGNAKQNLLDELKKGDALHGWGAILALGRDRFNQLLEAQFVDAFATQDFTLPISGEYFMENRTEKVVFDNLMLGPPQLSFKHASGKTAQVTVSMELIAGTCYAIGQHPGAPDWLRRSHRLLQGMGYHLEMQAVLQVVPLEASGQSQLILDLGAATEPTCNLGMTDIARRAMGIFIQQQLGEQRPEWRLPVLTLDMLGYDATSVADFNVLAQKAPQGAGSGASPADDGAVLLLLQLRGSVAAGDVPSALPYLLPAKDNGGGNYNAALLVDRLRAPLLGQNASNTLTRMLLPQAYQVRMSEEHLPHDMILFGDLEASAQSSDLQPALSSVAASQQVSYKLNGTPASAWSARNLVHPRACGAISQGRYTASAREDFVSDQQVVVVTAHVADAADSKPRTALLVECSESLAISPRVVLWGKGDGPVSLSASQSDGLRWELEGAAHGSLQPDPANPGTVQFVPKDQTGAAQVVLQRIKVTRGADSGYATVAILNYTPVLNVEPFHVSTMPASGVQTFALADFPADDWVLFGAGEIDRATGEYTAPESGAGEVSVVAGIAGMHAGFAVIEHQRNSPQQMASLRARWKTLNRFEVSLNNANRNRVLANGLQQVGIDILLETNSFEDDDGTAWDPVSDLELSTLVILHEDGTEVDYLLPGREGLDPDKPGDGKHWAVSKVRNRFDYLPTANRSAQASPAPQLAPADARRIVTVYVHCLEAEVRKFKAKFQDHANAWHYSELKEETNGVVQLEGVVVPPPNLGNYAIAPKRVARRMGFDHGQPLDTFNYWHYTTDYWVISARDTQFTSVSFDKASMIRWESELLKESYCTYTGFAFKPRRYRGAVPTSTGIEYQAELQLLAQESHVAFKELDYGFKGQEDVAEGSLLLSLDRVPNLAYWYDTPGTSYRKVLDKPLSLTLIDNFGIAHRLKVTFGAGADSRNTLTLDLQ